MQLISRKLAKDCPEFVLIDFVLSSLEEYKAIAINTNCEFLAIALTSISIKVIASNVSSNFYVIA